ncbi:MAG TPA: CsgG/HfaB family protein [Phycisphaerae bacterium]|nr:CsgG/HfaB family protein [Phycisphaerae bacterium]HQL72894.1 CsgG/HfaB family protein [Phycisphaerae bacterium]
MRTVSLIIVAIMLSGLVAGQAGCGSSNVPAGVSAPPPPPSAAPPPLRTYDYSHKVLASAKARAGKRWTVAILRFGDTGNVEGVPWGGPQATQPAQKGDVNVNIRIGPDGPTGEPSQARPLMNKRARDLLKHELVQAEAFNVVERERILEILREVNFGKTAFADPETAPDQGQLLCVRYLIEGSLGLNEDKTLKDTLDKGITYKDADCPPGLWDNIFNRGRVNREKMMIAINRVREERQRDAMRRTFNVACYLSVYDVHSGAVVTSVMGLGSNGLEAIQDAVEELVDALADQEGDVRVAAVIGDKVYLDRGSNAGMQKGARLQVVHSRAAVRDRDGQVIGHDQAEVAEIEVTDVQSQMSVAHVVQKAGEIARGDVARPAKH